MQEEEGAALILVGWTGRGTSAPCPAASGAGSCGFQFGVQDLADGEIPIGRKDHLKLQRGWALDPNMGVAPTTVFRILPEILVADIVPADEADPAVHDDVLAVIAEVEPPAVAPAAQGAEGAMRTPRARQFWITAGSWWCCRSCRSESTVDASAALAASASSRLVRARRRA